MEPDTDLINTLASSYGERWTIEEETRIGAAAAVTGAIPRRRAERRPGMDASPGARVLEVGCGNGRLLANLSEAGNVLVGVDRSEAMLREAIRRVPDALFVRASAEALPFRPGAFDAVLAVNVVHNLDDPRPLLVEAGRVSDRLIVDILNEQNPVVARRQAARIAAGNPGYRARRPRTWRLYLAVCGWAALERRAVVRPVVDPETGFRWSHLGGWLLGFIPGLAPVEVWTCRRHPGNGTGDPGTVPPRV